MDIGSAADWPWDTFFDQAVGATIAAHPPEDGRYLGSPSIVRLADGGLLATHDWFGPGAAKDRTEVYSSSDDGATWLHLGTAFDIYWATLFVHDGQLFLFGATREFGSVAICRSGDAGQTWTRPTGSRQGLLDARGAYHTAPTPILHVNGRLYRAMEEYYGGHDTGPFMLSAPDDCDVLDARNWTRSTVSPGVTNYLEGNPVATPDGRIWNVMRSRHHVDRAGIFELSEDGTELAYRRDVRMPGGDVKFSIRWDEISGTYVSVVNEHTDLSRRVNTQRNVLSLIESDDLTFWRRRAILLQDGSESTWGTSVDTVGFQYADWQFDGDDLLIASRTSYAGAHSFHDANQLTFHRVQDFRRLLSTEASVVALDWAAAEDRGRIVDGSVPGMDLAFALGNYASGAERLDISFCLDGVKPPTVPDGSHRLLLATYVEKDLIGICVEDTGDSIRITARSQASDPAQVCVFGYQVQPHEIDVIVDFVSEEIRLAMDGMQCALIGKVRFSAPEYRRRCPSRRDRALCTRVRGRCQGDREAGIRIARRP